MKLNLICASLYGTLFTTFAFAGGPAPLPIAGAVGGPVGLGVAIIGYGAYRYYKKQQDK